MRGFDIGLEMSGSPKAFIEMISNMYNGSSISLLGILPSNFEVPWSDIIFKAITLKGIYGREMWETWYKMEQMIIGGIDLKSCYHSPFPYRRLPERIRCHGKGRLRKSHIKLGLIMYTNYKNHLDKLTG